jgi:transposase-like protein
LLDDLVRRGLKTPELVIVDGAPGLEKVPSREWLEFGWRSLRVAQPE